MVQQEANNMKKHITIAQYDSNQASHQSAHQGAQARGGKA